MLERDLVERDLVELGLLPSSNFLDRGTYDYDSLKFDSKTHVDHVIPFDYIGDTKMWNLVLSCQKCNCEKLGNLPPCYFVKRLTNRNKKFKKITNEELNKSNDRKTKKNMKDIKEMLDMEGKENLDWHYANATNHGYPILNNFPKKIKRII